MKLLFRNLWSVFARLIAKLKLTSSTNKSLLVLFALIIFIIAGLTYLLTTNDSNKELTSTNSTPAAQETSDLTSDTGQVSDAEQIVDPSAPAQKPSSASGSQSVKKPSNEDLSRTNPVVNPPSSFGIVLSPWSVTSYDSNTISIPYGIKRLLGHTAPISSMSAQVPPGGTGITCTPMSSGPDNGEVWVHAPGSTPPGQYTCVVTMSDATLTRTAQFNFTVSSTTVTTPY